MPPPNDHLHLLAAELLGAVVVIFDDAGVDLPERQYVSDGTLPAHDCEQATVALARLYVGLPSAEQPNAIRCGLVLTAEFHVEIIRCEPSVQTGGAPPSAAVIQASAETVNTDTYVLAAGLIRAYKAGELFSACTEFALGDAVLVGPQGALGGVRLSVRVQVGT